MGPAVAKRPRVSHVLSEDPDLAASIPVGLREQATKECIAGVRTIQPGAWKARDVSLSREGIGLLVLRGLLIRRVGVEARFGAELLGAGDLLRPWQGEDEPPTLPVTTGWRVLQPMRIALLDAVCARRLARYPEVIGALVARALERSRNLAVNMAIVHQARVDVRLQMLFWHLAARWGRVAGDGVRLPLRLTHDVLADLVAARRPTVTSALSELVSRGLVQRERGLWLLLGSPPSELLELAPASAELTGGGEDAAPMSRSLR
ncbi:MAG TPA: helix-turn-helix domain-containing protein [Solirubrobacteraceae bacterium]|nr:helix-turn-helix domain-containing protein [Solirubrobacteraceae bacterium]